MKAANYAFQGAYLFDPDKLRNPSIQPGMKPIERDKLIIDPGGAYDRLGADPTGDHER
ncbi:hypothetical protein GGQ85_003707 [Nitrobacter vulgaris]|jgi:hypothetical protein|nr:hypothetical protein [Nitrobacter vulgaris]